jgi:hypothetical protein
MKTLNIVSEIFHYCMENQFEFELNNDNKKFDLIFEDDKKKVTLFMCDPINDEALNDIKTKFDLLKNLTK